MAAAVITAPLAAGTTALRAGAAPTVAVVPVAAAVLGLWVVD